MLALVLLMLTVCLDSATATSSVQVHAALMQIALTQGCSSMDASAQTMVNVPLACAVLIMHVSHCVQQMAATVPKTLTVPPLSV